MVTMAGEKEAGKCWLTESSRIMLEGWARDGMTDEQIAEEVGFRIQEFYTLAEKFPEIAEAIRHGREADDQVERALLDKAQAGDKRARAFLLSNHRL